MIGTALARVIGAGLSGDRTARITGARARIAATFATAKHPVSHQPFVRRFGFRSFMRRRTATCTTAGTPLRRWKARNLRGRDGETARTRIYLAHP